MDDAQNVSQAVQAISTPAAATTSQQLQAALEQPTEQDLLLAQQPTAQQLQAPTSLLNIGSEPPAVMAAQAGAPIPLAPNAEQLAMGLDSRKGPIEFIGNVPPKVEQPPLDVITPPINATAKWLVQPDETGVGAALGFKPPGSGAAEPEGPILRPEDLAPLTEPSVKDVIDGIDGFMGDVRAEKAHALALEGIDAMRRQAEERQKAREEETKQKFAELDAQVRTRSLEDIMTTGSFGSQLGAIIALSAGAVSQGLTGAKSNPVTDYLDKIAERQAAKDKLTLEQKQMLQRQLYEQGQLELQKLESATNSAYRLDSIRQQQAALNARKESVTQQLLAQKAKQVRDSSIWSGKALTPEQDAGLTVQERRHMVTLSPGPDGKPRRVLVQHPQDGQKFKEIYAEVGDALTATKEMRKYAGKWQSLIPGKSENVQSKSLMVKIMGGLRLPYTGPGVLTDSDKAQLKQVVGDPTSLWNWIIQSDPARLERLEKDLKARLEHEARVRGINERVTDTTFYNIKGKAVEEDAVLEMYKRRAPDVNSEMLLKKIREQVPRI
jgi:hypothetical protein